MTKPVNGPKEVQHTERPQNTKSTRQTGSEEADIGRLLVNKAGAVVMAPVAAGAGALTLVGSFLNGIFNPNTTLDESMTEGCQAAGQGADMLDKMWQGKFF